MKIHKKEQEQYKEDLKKYGTDAYKLWEINLGYGWVDCPDTPSWDRHTKYRRKDQPFQPKYFSGLNWREAEHLIGKTVEYSDEPDDYWLKGVLNRLDQESTGRFICRGIYWEYIRTCPETYAHPIITINVNGKDWVLPKPETKELDKHMLYFRANAKGEIIKYFWEDAKTDYNWLKRGHIHLTEDRAQAWADFWKEEILGAIKDN